MIMLTIALSIRLSAYREYYECPRYLYYYSGHMYYHSEYYDVQ